MYLFFLLFQATARLLGSRNQSLLCANHRQNTAGDSAEAKQANHVQNEGHRRHLIRNLLEEIRKLLGLDGSASSMAVAQAAAARLDHSRGHFTSISSLSSVPSHSLSSTSPVLTAPSARMPVMTNVVSSALHLPTSASARMSADELLVPSLFTLSIPRPLPSLVSAQLSLAVAPASAASAAVAVGLTSATGACHTLSQINAARPTTATATIPAMAAVISLAQRSRTARTCVITSLVCQFFSPLHSSPCQSSFSSLLFLLLN